MTVPLTQRGAVLLNERARARDLAILLLIAGVAADAYDDDTIHSNVLQYLPG